MVARTDHTEITITAMKYLDLLRKRNVVFEHAYLFGSFAKGTAREESDIDLAIIAKKWEPDIFDAQCLLLRLAHKIDSRIEPHPFRSADFDKTNPYGKEILSTGEKLV